MWVNGIGTVLGVLPIFCPPFRTDWFPQAECWMVTGHQSHGLTSRNYCTLTSHYAHQSDSLLFSEEQSKTFPLKTS